jgi:hypothetical protein
MGMGPRWRSHAWTTKTDALESAPSDPPRYVGPPLLGLLGLGAWLTSLWCASTKTATTIDAEENKASEDSPGDGGSNDDAR